MTIRPRTPRTGRGPVPAVTALVAAVLTALTACAPPPATGPRLATDDRPGGSPVGHTDRDPDSPPSWLAPEQELHWLPCAAGSTGGAHPGASTECAVLDSTPLVRLTTDRTPRDAPPLVVVAGAEYPAARFVGDLARAGTEIADAHPVVVLDHRGREGPPGSCLSPGSRRTLDGLADRGTDPGSPELRGALADTAQECTDALAGRELHFSSSHAAEDLAALRDAWGVPGLAVLGVGGGARTALAYASGNPGAVALLALDSPAPSGGDQEADARAALDGSDTALRLWAASCTRPECGPGGADERVDAVARALDAARGPRAPVPAALLADVIRDALADLAGASAPEAAGGDRILGDLVGARDGAVPTSVRTRAAELGEHSLPYVVGCSDLSRRVPVNRISELAAEWEDDAPFGPILAAQLSGCSTWPVPSPEPVSLPAPVPVLLLSGTADPVLGAAALEPTAAALTAAGAREVRTVGWGAPGSRVVLHSGCARTALVAFLDDPTGAEDAAVCPS